MILHSILTHAFTYHSNIETLAMKEGLANNTILCILQDKENFMWFGTDLGISRYDGFHFRNFVIGNNPLSVMNIQESVEGLFFMNTLTGSLHCFDRIKEMVVPIITDNGLSLEEVSVFQIIEDSVLYAATTKGLFKYQIHIHTNGEQKQIVLSGTKDPIIKDKLSLLCKDENNCLYGLKDNSSIIISYNTSGRSEEYDLSPLSKDTSTWKYNTLCVYNNCLWICKKWSGIICYDLKNKIGQLLKQQNESTLLPLQYTDVNSVIPVDKQTYYLSTRTGFYSLKFDGSPATSSFTIDNSLEKQHSPLLETMMISSHYNSNLKQLWIGTFGGGIIKVNMNDVFHNQIYLNEKIQVNGLAEDNKGYIWLATYHSGILKSQKDTLTTQTTFSPWRKAGNPAGKYILHKDKNGQLWFGDNNGEFIHVDPLTEKSTAYKLPAEIKSRINNMLWISPDTLWLATTKGLTLFNPTLHTFKQYNPFHTNNRGITAIIEDNKKKIWLGTEYGLMRMDVSEDSISYINGYEKQVGLEPSMVYSLQICQGHLLLATYADKVLLLDSHIPDNVINSVSLKKGLTNGHIYCSISDHIGNIWLGSNSGIMTLRNDGNSFYNYLYSGNNNSVCLLHDGRLLWSNSWGLLFYNPAIVKENKIQQSLVISSIAINNKYVKTNEELNGQIVLPYASNTLNELTFNHYNNNFTLYFTDLQYNNSIQRKIAYRLLPEEQEWTETPLGQGLSFRLLKNGTHTLQVYTTFYDGSKGDLKEIKITILPRWFETIEAYMLYITLTLLLVLGIWKYFQINIHKRQLQKERERQKEAIEERNELFILVAHELRTPLSLIVAPLQDILQTDSLSEEIQIRLKIAYQNTVSLQNTCNRLLDISNNSHNEDLTYPYFSQTLEDKIISITDIMDPKDNTTNKKKLLIVEDNKSIRLYLQLLFTSQYIILQAADGQEGIDIALKEIPDAILCDIMMPVKDGLACCREIKENLETCHIPIVILTAKVEDSDIIKGIETGADDYLVKPFNPELLKSKITNLINNRMKLKQSYMKQIMIPEEEESKDIQLTHEDEFIHLVVQEIENNISKVNFNVKKLADTMRMSQSTLYRKIKQSTGFTTIELIRGVRLKQAAILLKKQVYTVQEVAEKVGYNDIPTFRKHFTEFFSQLPSNYGKN